MYLESDYNLTYADMARAEIGDVIDQYVWFGVIFPTSGDDIAVGNKTNGNR